MKNQVGKGEEGGRKSIPAEGTACAKCLNQGPVRALARMRLVVRERQGDRTGHSSGDPLRSFKQGSQFLKAFSATVWRAGCREAEQKTETEDEQSPRELLQHQTQ